MGEASTRLGLPFLATGQAQKEVTHNEALALVDLSLHAAVEAIGVNVPPSAPQVGRAWVVGSAPTGAWAGRAHALAGWTGGGWRFLPATEGMCAWVRGEGMEARFSDGGWTVGEVAVRKLVVNGHPVVGARQPAVADPAGGATVDAEARSTLAAVLAALREHGLIAS